MGGSSADICGSEANLRERSGSVVKGISTQMDADFRRWPQMGVGRTVHEVLV
jgi:hypothetical protein